MLLIKQDSERHTHTLMQGFAIAATFLNVSWNEKARIYSTTPRHLFTLTSTIGLIDHWLDDSTSGIDEPFRRERISMRSSSLVERGARACLSSQLNVFIWLLAGWAELEVNYRLLLLHSDVLPFHWQGWYSIIQVNLTFSSNDESIHLTSRNLSAAEKEEDRQICLEKNDISPRAMINDVRRAEKRDTVTSVRLEETTDVYTNREQANAFVSILPLSPSSPR